jgi:AraC-like DNA-binding protein
MQFDFSFFSSLLLIFFVHGLIYALLLYRKGVINETVSDKWLSFFLVLCVLYITPWMLGFAGWYDNQPYRDIMFYVPFVQRFLLGPVFFFYVQSLLNPSFTITKKMWLHFLPSVLYFIFCSVVVVVDKLILHRYYFLASGADPDFDFWYEWLGFLSMVIYFIFSLRYYYAYQKIIVQVASNADAFLFKWIRNFLIAFLCMLFFRLAFTFASFIPVFAKWRYMGTWWEYFSFGIVLYYIAVSGYSNSIETKISFKLNLLGYQKPLLLNYTATTFTQEQPIEDAEFVEIDTQYTTQPAQVDNELTAWKIKVEELMHTQKIYTNPELSLTQVAKLLKTNPSILSKVINQGFQLNFNDFINNYRIKAVKEKLNAGEQKTQTLLGIAFDCGFNSKATFNRAFKKETGVSPKEWLSNTYVNE